MLVKLGFGIVLFIIFRF